MWLGVLGSIVLVYGPHVLILSEYIGSNPILIVLILAGAFVWQLSISVASIIWRLFFWWHSNILFSVCLNFIFTELGRFGMVKAFLFFEEFRRDYLERNPSKISRKTQFKSVFSIPHLCALALG